MTRTDIINTLIEKFGYQSYLEIGIADPGENFLKINCKIKECVDPYEPNTGNGFEEEPVLHNYIIKNILTYKMTSDEFFAQCPADKKYDIIFIDGLHFEEQVGRDIINSFVHLNVGGVIIVHDCLPPNKDAQDENRHTDVWNGSVWKVIPQLTKQGIRYCVVDADYGCGILQYEGYVSDLCFPEKADYTYEQVFSSKTIRDLVMNVITPDEFLVLEKQIDDIKV